MLRSFVGENGSFSETDLSNCLRQSGYLVELAAEKLMTGQYQPPAKKQRPSPSFIPISSIKRQKQQGSSPPRSQSTTGTTTTTTTSRQPQHPNSIKKKKTPAMASSAAASKVVVAKKQPALVTPKTPKQQHLNSDDIAASGAHQVDDWLLCQRWVGDGICTQRNGSCDFQEVLEVEACDSGGLLRFRGRRIHGQFPKALCRILSPLLLKDKNISNQYYSHRLRLEATALMEERHLPMGAQVAFSLR
jgi:hypothetical protein